MTATTDDASTFSASLRVLGIAGSLRAGSYNRALLRAAQEEAPSGMEIQLYDLAPIPFYNADVEARGDPEPVAAFKAAIRAADALLIATPEYNHGVPGVLKNALDWASRPHRASPLDCKPVAIMGATAGRGSTFQAQAQVREALVYAGSCTLAQPELSLSRAGPAFDDALQPVRLTDADTRSALHELLDAFAEWIHVIRTGEGERYAALHAHLSSDGERMPRASQATARVRAPAQGRVLQPPFHLFRRDIKRDILPQCQEHGIGALVYGPLAHSLLASGNTPQTTFFSDDRRSKSPEFIGARFAQNLAVVDRLKGVVAWHGITVAQVAVAWVLANPVVDIAIVGARNSWQIEQAAPAADVHLSP